MNRALLYLKEKEKDLSMEKKHNDYIDDNQDPQIENWRREGVDEDIIQYRCIRFFGDPLPYDKRLHDDIISSIKILETKTK
jgi:hypothetical protein